MSRIGIGCMVVGLLAIGWFAKAATSQSVVRVSPRWYVEFDAEHGKGFEGLTGTISSCQHARLVSSPFDKDGADYNLSVSWQINHWLAFLERNDDVTLRVFSDVDSERI